MYFTENFDLDLIKDFDAEIKQISNFTVRLYKQTTQLTDPKELAIGDVIIVSKPDNNYKIVLK